MNFTPTEEQLAVQKTARDFAHERGAAEGRRDRSRAPSSRPSSSKRMAELGFLGIAVPEQYGGAGLDNVSYALAMEEISPRVRVDRRDHERQQLARLRSDLSSSAPTRRSRSGSTPLARGKLLGCFALTEPEAGSRRGRAEDDRREARRRPWVINGTKNWITNGPVADVCVLFTMNDKAAGHKGITAFILPMKTKGVRSRPARRQARHPRQQVVRRSSRRRAAARPTRVLGEVGGGFKVAMSTLDGGRIGIAAQALGIARAALEDALAYAQQRRTFGKPIVAAPGDRVQARRHGDRDRRGAPAHAARRVAQGQQAAVRQGSGDGEAVRVATSRTRRRAKAIQIFGGNGYVDRVPGRAALPRREDHRDLRRHERDPAPGDRRAISRRVDDDDEERALVLAVLAAAACGGKNKNDAEEGGGATIDTERDDRRSDRSLGRAWCRPRRWTRSTGCSTQAARSSRAACRWRSTTGELPKNARGKITLEITIAPSGKATNVEVIKSSIESQDVQGCVKQQGRGDRVPELPKQYETSYTYAMEAN